MCERAFFGKLINKFHVCDIKKLEFFFPKIENLVELALEKNIFPNYSQFFSKKMTKFVGRKKKKKKNLAYVCV